MVGWLKLIVALLTACTHTHKGNVYCWATPTGTSVHGPFGCMKTRALSVGNWLDLCIANTDEHPFLIKACKTLTIKSSFYEPPNKQTDSQHGRQQWRIEDKPVVYIVRNAERPYCIFFASIDGRRRESLRSLLKTDCKDIVQRWDLKTRLWAARWRLKGVWKAVRLSWQYQAGAV